MPYANPKAENHVIAARRAIRLLSIAAVLAASVAVSAQQPPRHRLVYEAVLGARANPLGAALALDAGYRYRLFDSDSILLRDAFAGLSVQPEMTPSNYRVGLAAVVEPLAILRLKAAVSYIGYFGTFDELQSYPDARADWRPEALSAGGQSGLSYASDGLWVTLFGRLQAKVGPVAVRNGLRFIRSDMNLADGDTVYYDSTLDILMPGEGWSFVNEADVLFLGWERWIIGLRYVATGALHGAPDDDLATHRLGPIIAHTFRDAGDPRLSEPTVALITGWWLSHPYRTGQSVSRAMPYVTVAFAVNGDLL